jgi:hypothetical protein
VIGRPLAPAAELQQNAISSRGDVAVEPKGKLRLLSLIVLVWGCLTLIILGVVTVARIGTMPQLPDLPRSHLPGSRLPDEVSCSTQGYDPTLRCSIQHLGHAVHFLFDADTQIITHTVVPARNHTLGQLILFWGTPSGIIQTPQTTYVHWETRTAYLYTGLYRPDSRVLWVVYTLQPKPASPWRGFRRRQS